MEIDHIGFVVSNIDNAIQRFTNIYGFSLVDEWIYDPNQHVNLAILTTQNHQRVELIQPIDEKSPSYDFLKKRGGLHHICYCVENLDLAISMMKQNGHILIRRPVQAPLLQGRKVAFLFSKIDKQIIELVSKE